MFHKSYIFNDKTQNQLILFAGSIINLLYMHYTIIISQNINNYTSHQNLEFISYFFNFSSVLLDTCCLIVFFGGLTVGRIKISLIITFIVTLIWSFANIQYSRFFHQYISFSAILQLGSLANSLLLNCIKESLKWTDSLFLIWGLIFYQVCRRTYNEKASIGICSIISFPIISYIICFALMAIIYRWGTPRRYFNYYKARTSQILISSETASLFPTVTTFHRGCIRSIDFMSSLHSNELTHKQKRIIDKEIKNSFLKETKKIRPKEIKNVIFIIVESYLSVTSDLKISGQEITPFLNSLKRNNNVYYNGEMQSNICAGESSDGQFIYLTGLLPLRSEITITKAKNNELPSLAKAFKKIGIKKSKMIIPTHPSLWEQNLMCRAYGIEALYSNLDFRQQTGEAVSRELNDEEVFKLATQTDKATTEPFFSIILTMSMHEPYSKPIKHDFKINDSSLPEKYLNYLIACHYTDSQIAKYFNYLKSTELISRSLIVIAADHQAHPAFFDMDDRVSENIPIFIINGNIDNKSAWSGACNQLDLYTTILDIMASDYKWKGLGKTLLSTNYDNSSIANQEISDWIINSDYFKDKHY